MIDDNLIAWTEQGAGDGWYLDETTDPIMVVIQGSTCRDLQIHGARQMLILQGCPTLL